jgi:hypothetical protein
VSWKVTEDALLYYTWSQGFRAGGFNRTAFAADFNSPLAAGNSFLSGKPCKHGGWVAPLASRPIASSTTSWLEDDVDGPALPMEWGDLSGGLEQRADQCGVNGVISNGITLNGGNYRVRGVETSGVARVTTGLTLEAGAAWNHSELVKQAPFLWQDGTPIDFSSLQPRAGSFRIRAGHSAARSPARPPFRATSARAMSFRSMAITRSLRSTRCISHTRSPRPIGFRSTCRATLLLTTCPLSQLMMGRSVSERTRGSCKHTERI